MSPEAERAALEAVERISPRLRGILLWFRVPQEDAEELHQEALLALIRCWEKVDSPEAWLIGAIFRLCRRYRRKQKEREWHCFQAESWLLETLAPLGAPDQIRSEIRLDLGVILRHLSEREQSLLKLRAVGLSGEEVAERLGCQPSSIGKMTSRALAEARRIARRIAHPPRSRASLHE